MRLYRYLALLLFFGLACVPASQAQIDDVTIAPSYQLVVGRLSVTFVDTVSEASAVSSLEVLGFEVVQRDFPPVLVIGLIEGSLTEEQLTGLKSHAAIEDVTQEQPTQLTIALSPTLTPEQASKLVTLLVPGLVIQRAEKRPNEAIIAVEEGAEEDAIAQIDALPDVRYVAYINAN